MKKLRINLVGEAEVLYNKLKSEGMSDTSIIGKALKCIELVRNGELVSSTETSMTVATESALTFSQVEKVTPDISNESPVAYDWNKKRDDDELEK